MEDQRKMKVPQIRFKGFSDEWLDKSFTDLTLSLTGGAAIKPEDYLNDGVKTVPKGAINSTGIADLSGSKFVSKEFFILNVSSKVTTGSLITSLRDLVPSAPSMGRIVKIVGEQEYYLMPQGVYKIMLHDNVDENFVISKSNTNQFRKIISREKNGSTQVHIRNGEFLSIRIFIPSHSEQIKIGYYFQELDRMIGLHQRKHEKLVTLKKAMLKKMFPQNCATTPEIRFKGFSEPWEEKKLGEIMTNISNNTLSRAELNYKSGLAKNVHYGDILIKFREILNVNRDEIPFISNGDLASKLKPSMLQDGDIIIADAAEDESVGKCTEIINVGDEIVLAGLHTIALRPIVSCAPMYLGYFMNSPTYHDQLLRLMQGTKVLSISKSVIKHTSIFLPKDETEQEKIGIYFRQLDKLIAQHGTQMTKLKQVKAACLEKMYV